MYGTWIVSSDEQKMQWNSVENNRKNGIFADTPQREMYLTPAAAAGTSITLSSE
jgi:hypothetical protein